MKKNILTLATLFIALTVCAQSSEESRAILDRAFASYESSNGISLLFTINVTEANGVTHQAQSGEAKIKGDKFRLIMSGIDIWFDGTTQWVLMRDVDEVSITNPTGNDIAAISPLALLGMYKTGFSLNQSVSKTVNGRNSYVIDMVPVLGNNDFREVSVAIDKQTNTIVQVNLTLSNGMKNRIDITNYNANHNFSDSEFVFNPSNHPNIEIVDLR
ncbi:MAG: outer membrane lipoprotein carrier protein LolA [Dysgonamonadaceae bacterium]|jgi:outer membrane lipoprotein-sorting protein|nr:outer membrane lipoprotein carrier protein LolA [Dysgonamonadaceae bacterium]